jgi:hypothetical protein
MKLYFYDIITEVIAAQRFPALALLALARKCHETCGYVTFCEILGCPLFPKSGQTRAQLDCPLCAKSRHAIVSIKYPRTWAQSDHG